MRGLVYGVYVLEILQVIFILMFAWDMFVNGYGNPSVLFVITWPDAAHSMTGALIAGMVQLFFAWRVYSLRKHSLLVRGVSILIVLLGLLQTLSGIVGASLFLEASAKSSNSELAKLSSLVELWLISSFVCDLVVATAMTAILINYSNRSLVKSTRAMVKNLVIHSVETGTVTVAAALLDLVLFFWCSQITTCTSASTPSCQSYTRMPCWLVLTQGKGWKMAPQSTGTQQGGTPPAPIRTPSSFHVKTEQEERTRAFMCLHTRPRQSTRVSL